MIEPAEAGALVCFRVMDRIDDPRCTRFHAARLADHRREFLNYQGKVSGGRGDVVRVASGTCHALTEAPGLFLIHADFGLGPCVFRGTQAPGVEGWIFDSTQAK